MKPISMSLVSIRIITADVSRLVEFYENITGLPAVMHTEDFAELVTPACTLAIGSIRTVQHFGAGVARPANNYTAIIEFRVADVDTAFNGLREVIAKGLVQPPTTMPWGNRSLLFRDPDGNLINFFTPVSTQAIRRLDR